MLKVVPGQHARWFEPSNALIECIRSGILRSLQAVAEDLAEKSALEHYQSLSDADFSHFLADQTQSLVDAILLRSQARKLKSYLFGKNARATLEFAADARTNMPFEAFEHGEAPDILFRDLVKSVGVHGGVAIRGGKLELDHDALVLAIEDAPLYPDARPALKYQTKVFSLEVHES